MSHFLLYVLVSEEEEMLGINNSIEKLMEPYNENHEVEPYDRDCYCKEHLIHVKAREKVEKELGTIEQWRENYKEEDGVDWSEYIAPFLNRQDSIIKELKPFAKSDANCETCGGSGFYKSTYNPNSKWDWYVIGGRWHGVFTTADNELVEKDQYKDSFIGNAIQTSDALKLKDSIPYALLSPRGWHERGKMLMFGVSTDEKEEDLWEKEVKAVYNEYPNHHVVAIDCHI